MLTIFGRRSKSDKFCDGYSRRDFLTIGSAAAVGGLTLPQLLRAESCRARDVSTKQLLIYSFRAVLHIRICGISNQMLRLKFEVSFPQSPPMFPESRLGELFPKMAQMMDKFTVIRSIEGAAGGHAAYQAMTHYAPGNEPTGGWPSIGAWVSKVQGQVNPSVPAHVSMFYKTGHNLGGDPGNGGFLGMAHGPFRLVGGKGETSKTDNMVLKGISLERLQDRNALLASVDRIKREVDLTGSMDGMDAFTQQAVGILTSSQLVDAMDISSESKETLERYGKGGSGIPCRRCS